MTKFRVLLEFNDNAIFYELLRFCSCKAQNDRQKARLNL